MANHKSAIKRARQSIKREAANKSRLSRIHTYEKKFEIAIANVGDKNSLLSSFSAFQSELHRGVSKGVLRKNTASRKISRLARRLKAIAS